ncbi:uncharacterized protein PGRI_018810 [Penicillium griseofulvum]|uniref:DUF7514 domain-containing protein n=1 Tax=Penicillium patulum TaxID=5078 RepID=A0A135LG95_PENPA|nr:uncharacterized protein PGRI_018810 [Penicillium griseofulvum]KXG48011.1 hypothetical protein PGRI_018810 [Penicillium griseofulvum]
MNPDPNGYAYSPAPPYPSHHEQAHLNMPQPQVPRTGSRAPSPNPEPYSYPEPQRPSSNNTNTGHIDDAVSSAFHNSGSTGYLSPEVLSQITATVIQQLKTTGLDNIQGSGAAPPRSQSQQPPWQTDSSLQPNAEFTPGIPPQRSSSIPPPSSAADNIHTGNFQPYVPSGYASDSYLSLKPTPESVPESGSIASENSDRSHHSYHKAERPKPPDRDATVMEMTTLERIWGKLFEDGKATKRLGQFLRGIAVHLIEDYPPGNTIVIPPHKLQKFYRDTHDPSDPYPWQDIFDDRTSSISRLFRELKVEHHLIQDDIEKRPDIPGLTPKGFETWATLMILANPGREYERLQKAVLNMPINNPDDKKERFPKELPRRLFPEVGDIAIREDIEDRMMIHCGVDLPYITPEERNQSTRPTRSSTTTGSPTERAHSYERGRPRPTGSTPRSAQPQPRPVSTAVTDDEDEPAPSVPIERERKPYTANPGVGKVYDESAPSRSHASSFSTSRPSDSTYKGPASGPTPAYMSDSYDRDPHFSRSGSGHSTDKRFSHDSRSSSQSGKHHRGGDYRHSESDLHGRDHSARYSGLSAHDLAYSESPTANDDDARRYHRGSRGSEEEYYRSGQNGGSGAWYDKYDKYAYR